MAKKLKFTKTTIDKLSVNGVLSEDCDTITYIDEDDAEKEINLAVLLNAFKNCEINLTVGVKQEEDLDIITPDDESEYEYDEE